MFPKIFFPLPFNLLEGDLPAHTLPNFVFLLIPCLAPEANDEGEPGEDEELLDMDEEAALIEAERILEDSDPKGRDGRERKQEEEIITELAEVMLAMNLNQADEQPSQGRGKGQVDHEVWEVRILWNSHNDHHNE